jgi:peptidyl-prolyl cis-trans isomerase SurA
MTLTTFLRLFSILAALSPGTAPATGNTTSRTIDHILVVVNDDIITARDVDTRVESVRHRLAAQKTTLPPDEVLHRQVLERMIIERLQLQLAKSHNISINDDQLNRTLRAVSEQSGKTSEEFRREAENRPGGLKLLRDEIREQLVTQQLIDREINNRILVTEAEVESFLAAQRSRGGESEFNFSHILIALPESASPETIAAARQRMEKIHRELKQGADFSQLAVTHSQGQRALEGGGLGWKSSGQLPDLFVNALVALQPGEVSEVLRSPSGFHILKLNDRRGGSAALNVTQTRTRHILIKVSELTPAPEARRRIALLRERLLAGGDFAQTARAQSEDIGSAANGGDLGWMNPGQTVAEFEKVMNTLKPGELSEPVRSPFGYHLIEVLERRERDVSQERDIANARRQIHTRKADERLEQWLRQLRDEAYVEYRNESGK